MTSQASAAETDAAPCFASAPDCLILPLKRGFFCADLIDMPNFLVYNGRVVEKSTMENMMQQDVFEQFSLLILKMSKVVQKIKALEMVLAVYKSGATGKPVRFPLGDYSTLDVLKDRQ